jgi:hypothetical protein
MRTLPFFFAGLALLLPLSASAQEAPGDVLAPAQRASVDRTAQRADTAKSKLPVSVKDKTDKKAREALEKLKIDLDLKNAEPQEAFQLLMKQIKVDYDIDTAFYPFGAEELDFPERGLNMKLTNASAARALDSFCQALGIGWWAEKVDDTVMVHIVKLQGTMGKMDMLAQLGVDVQGLAAPAVALANQALHAADLAALGGSVLPDKRVKADATSPRDIKTLIEELCKQAGLVYAIDSDVPSTSKVLAFENVPIRVALEALCATANLSMSVSRKGDKGERIVVTFSKEK